MTTQLIKLICFIHRGLMHERRFEVCSVERFSVYNQIMVILDLEF